MKRPEEKTSRPISGGSSAVFRSQQRGHFPALSQKFGKHFSHKTACLDHLGVSDGIVNIDASSSADQYTLKPHYGQVLRDVCLGYAENPDQLGNGLFSSLQRCEDFYPYRAGQSL